MTRAAGGRDEGSKHEEEEGEALGRRKWAGAVRKHRRGGEQGLDEFKITLITLKSLWLCVFAVHDPPLIRTSYGESSGLLKAVPQSMDKRGQAIWIHL